MFTSPKRAKYCNRGDGKLIPTPNSEEQRDMHLKRMSEPKTKGYLSTAKLLGVCK